MKILVFAEKPSVGKDIARILHAKNRGNGYLEGEKYVVTWGIGHLVSLGHPEIQNPAWKNWRLDNLPMLPENWKLSVIASAEHQYEQVERLFNRSDVELIINAADAGREGELIFRLVYQKTGCIKPFKRLWISSMTDEAIVSGFEDLRPGTKYDNLAKAAVCRSRADWLVGMNLTRAYTKKLNEMFTVGRVQTPTLAMVVNRHLEIQNFVSKDYWELNAKMIDFEAQWFNPDAPEQPARIDSLENAQLLADKVKGQTALIHSVKKTSKKQSPPSLYDLTTLQREANTKFAMTASDTLSVLQGLYEKKKVVTYPRTDSRYLSEDIFPTIEKRLATLPNDYEIYLDWLRKNRPQKDKRIFNNAKVSDHHAIIPTEKKVISTDAWTKEEKNIYDLIVKRFLAVFYPDHKYLSTVVILKAAKENFKATGKVVTEEGWKILYAKKISAAAEQGSEHDKNDASEDEDSEQALPDLKKGDERIIADAAILTKKTKPPAAYTEATLLQAMETAGKFVESEELREAMKDGGLGTPATRAEIIEKLIKVEYMARDKKKLVPTEKGIKLVQLAESEITSPELTGYWEKRLADIAKNADNDEGFMKDIATFVSGTVVKIKDSQLLRSAAQPYKGNKTRTETNNEIIPHGTAKQKMMPPVSRQILAECPACNKGGIIEGNRGYGCNRFKEGCNFVIWKEFCGKKLPETAVKMLMQGKTTRVLKGFKLEDGTIVSARVAMKEDKSGIELLVVDDNLEEK